MRGKTISSANFVWPVHFARASTLRKGLPTTLSFPLLLLLFIVKISHRCTQIYTDKKTARAERIAFFICVICVHLWLTFIPIHTNSRAAIPFLRHAFLPPPTPLLRKS